MNLIFNYFLYNKIFTQMKKNLKFMLVALFAVFGFNSAWAALDDVFDAGNYQFRITKEANQNKKGGTVQILGLTDAAKALKNTNGEEPYISNGVLEFPATAENEADGITYTVTTMASETFKDVAYYAKEVTIPASLTEIPVAAFNTLTNLETINFAENSQVKRIGAQAFASTRIKEFDFTNCVELEGLNDEVFVERCSDADRNANNGFNPNVNSYIEKVTVPTSPKFKHINGAFRNLTELTEIAQLENSWIQEIAPSAFAKTKLGTTETKPLVLPEKDLLYIDQNALKGSKVAYLEIKMGSLLYVGGCNVTYTQNDQPGDNYGAYTYTYTVLAAQDPAETADSNLYGLTAPTTQNPAVAPLVSLKLTGTQKGKICTNAFAWCEKLNGLDLTNLFYGSKAQFETSSFEGCKLIKELVINPINNNETTGYTFEEDAFKKTPIATLTIKSVGTAKAVNRGAFGSSLKTVTIGTVDVTGAAAAPAFAESAFIFDKVSEVTLNLATGEGEYLNSKDAQNAIIAQHAFNFSAIYELETIANNFVFPVVKIGEIKSKGAVFAYGALYGPVKEIEFTGDIARNGLTVGGADTGDNEGVKILEEGSFAQGSSHANVTSVFTTLTFNGKIGTNGIGSGAFVNFTEMTSVTFNGLLAELAVADYSFTGSGKTNNNLIGTKNAPFVKYTVSNIDNWAVNPFDPEAFGSEHDFNALDTRIIWWSITDEKLKEEISYAIHKAVCDADDTDDLEYDLDKTYNTKFNVFKWVDILYVAPTPEEAEAPNFLFFQDLQNNNKIAWGRYDLGSFTKEKGKYATTTVDPTTGAETWVNAYEATNMVIPRIQETTGAKVKLTLYGVYYDEDGFSKQSTTYLVPLRLVNGTYQIPANNEHVIIGKAEVLDGEFTDKDVKIKYNNVKDGDHYIAAWESDDVEENFNADNNAVWSQLATEERVYNKATEDDVKTHQELWDVVKRYQGSSVDRSGKNLWVMTDPAKYKGFRIDSNPITKDNYTFIGLDWYYVLLNNYSDDTAPARVIWLDEDQATAIFGVKQDAATKKNYVEDDAIYNLQGVRVSPFVLQKGQVYIQGGKKFINK